jgi:hypothetical protein
MKPGKYNITCPQGSTFQTQLVWEIDDVPVNLIGYTARMQVREKHTSITPIVDMSTENDMIVLGGEAGTINLLIPNTTTEDFHPKCYVYDLEVMSPSNTFTRLLEGTFTVTPEVTR